MGGATRLSAPRLVGSCGGEEFESASALRATGSERNRKDDQATLSNKCASGVGRIQTGPLQFRYHSGEILTESSAACDHDQEIRLDRFLRRFHARQHAAAALGRRRRNRRNLDGLSVGPVSLDPMCDSKRWITFVSGGMKLACTNPCRSKLASHRLSFG